MVRVLSKRAYRLGFLTLFQIFFLKAAVALNFTPQDRIEVQNGTSLGVEALKTAHREGQQTIASLTNERQLLISQAHTSLATINTLTNNKQALLSQAQIALDTINTLTNNKQALLSQAQTAQDTITTLTNDKQSLLSQAQTAQDTITALTNDKQSLLSQAQTAQDTITTLTNDKQSLLSQAQTAQDTINTLTAEKQALLSQAQTAQDTINTLTAEKQVLLSQAQTAQDTINTLTAEKQVLLSQAQTAQATISTLNSLVASEQAALQAGQTDITTARGNIDTMLGSTDLTTYLKAVALRESLRASETTITSAITVLNTLLGGSGTTYARAQAFRNLLLTTPTNIIADVATLRGYMVTSLGATAQVDLNTLAQALTSADASSGSTLLARMNAIKTILGAGADLNASAGAILAALLTTPTNVVADVATLRGYMVDSLGATAQVDLNTLAQALTSADASSGSTLLARMNAIKTILGAGADLNASAGAILAALLTTPTNVVADVATLRGYMVDSLGVTAQVDLNTLAQILTGVDASAGSTLQARIVAINTLLGGSGTSYARAQAIVDAYNTLNTLMTSEQAALQASQSDITTARGNINTVVGSAGATTHVKAVTARDNLKASETSIATAITALNALLGGSGTTHTRAQSVASTLDGVQSLSGLTSFTVTTAASNSSGTVSIIGNDGSAGRNYSIDYTSSIAAGGAVILTHSGSGNTITFINNSGGSITSAASLAAYLATAYPVSTVIKASLSTKASALKRILTTSTGNVSGDIARAQGLVVNTPGATLQADVDTVTGLIDGSDTSSGVLETKLTTVKDYIDSSATTIQIGLENLLTLLVGNTNFSLSLFAQISSQSSALDNSVTSLPNGATYGTITEAASSDDSGGVKMKINFGNGGETYNLPAHDLNIPTGSSFTLSNGGNNLVLKSTSVSIINNQVKALNYLRSMYPVGSKFTIALSDKITNLQIQIGGPGNSIQRVANLNRNILTTPTGVLSADFQALREHMVSFPGITAQGDVESLALLLTGTSSGSTLEARIGAPMVNGMSSNVLAIIGGSASSIAEGLGDPVSSNSTGLSNLIKGDGTQLGVVNGFDCSAFDNATTLHDQLTETLVLLGQKFNGGSPFTSIREALSIALNA
jgi:flagellar biosynthesis/type III secretory pathway chaperone